MKTKHTFAFTLLLGLIWTGILFAHATGPDPGVNGVFDPVTKTCKQSMCHNDFPLNLLGGSVSISGLPSTWSPGQTYPLTVTVNRSGTARYGFQFTAVNNSSNAQAGTLLAASPTDNRVSICPGGSGCVAGGSLQAAQHNSFANTSGVFNFRWTAPASAGFGAVRFNVAGNATNNSNLPTGDFIYTTSSVVSPAASDTTPPVISAVTSSSIATSSATILWTTDEASDTQVEFGPTTAYGQSTTLNATLSTSHSASLAGLASNTTYHYRVKSKDALQNLATAVDKTFITAFGISNLGGVSRTTDGSGNLTIGYGRILATSGTTPSGVGIFGLRQSGILVTEAGVPDQPLLTSGRIYAEVSAESIPLVNTGLAFANPNPTAAAITYTIRDTNGNTIKSGPATIEANSELVGFLNESPYLSGGGIQGTFSFTSTIPVAVIALRSFYNERTPSEFMLTTLPVVDLAAAVNSGTQVVPHFAAGDGWTTQIILVNPTGVTQTGTIQFLDPGAETPPTPGVPTTVTIDGTAGSSAAYSVESNSSTKFLITGGSLVFGSVLIVPAGGGAAPTPLVIFTFRLGGFTQSEAGIPVTMGAAFRMFAQLSSSPQILTGVAIANPSAVAGTVTLTLTDLNGVQIAQTTPPMVLPASGQIVKFIDQMPFIPSVAGQTLQGVLRITTDLPSISVAGLRGRYNERADFLITTTPPTLENSIPGIAERLFPHLANGEGYTTQFILFSGTSGQTSGGTLSFVNPDGTPLSLNIN